MRPVPVVAQTPADYYWWKALERAERGDLAEAGEDLRSAARYTSDPEFAFAVTSTLLDVDTGLALAEYAQTLRRAKRPHEAVVIEERAALFRQAKFGGAREGSSVYLGFSPSDLLKEYASELRQLGSADEARRIEDMAERYRQVQAEHLRRLRERQR
jgi:tetratricopeptide (TPR) repeat protein